MEAYIKERFNGNVAVKLSTDSELYKIHIHKREREELAWSYSSRLDVIVKTTYFLQDGKRFVQRDIIGKKWFYNLGNKYLEVRTDEVPRPFVVGTRYDKYLDTLKNDTDEKKLKEELTRFFKTMFNRHIQNTGLLDGIFFDAIPQNIIYINSEYEFIDKEWVLKGGVDKSLFVWMTLWNVKLLPLYDYFREKFSLKHDSNWGSQFRSLLEPFLCADQYREQVKRYNGVITKISSVIPVKKWREAFLDYFIKPDRKLFKTYFLYDGEKQ